MPRSAIAVFPLLLWLATFVSADEFEQPPIEYSQTEPHNSISELQQKLNQQEIQLQFDNRQGYLSAVLEALEIPAESQMLVFSKTSLQRHRITPKTPRAIYFNDDVYVGYCQAGEVLEISVADANLGTVFYTLDQREQENPRFTRQTENCLICHSSSRSGGVPGHVVRSLFVDAGGQPIFSAGGFTVDYTTPFENRWGGWYVTGKHGDQKHLGNLIIRGKEVPQPVENEHGQNTTELAEKFTVARYLTPHSDLVALMVLEHQTFVHNRLVKANFTTRQALHYEQEFKRALKEEGDEPLESTVRRIQSAGNELVEALLLVDETRLTAPVSGTSGFAEIFSQRGPRDSKGRSLRDFDLQTRMFRYPCSYLIYSQAFDSLPPKMSEYVWRRLWTVLANNADPETFAHLSAADRTAIIEILRETKPNLPQYWRE